MVRVAYDPERVSFESLLRAFWEAHDPTQGMRQGNDRGTQYRSAIYVADADEMARAEASRAMYQEHLSAAGFGPITTEIALAGPFFFAEGYHQQYLDKNIGGYDPAHGTGVACGLPTGVSFDGPAPEPRRAITTPEKIWMRSLSPSRTFVWTRTPSPTLKGGRPLLI